MKLVRVPALIWEPDPLQAQYLGFVLQQAGFQAQHLERWQNFEVALASLAAYPFLVVLALGHDIAKSLRHCQRLRQRYPLMTLIVLSHHQGQFDAQQSIEAEVFKAGADDYLQKPLDSNALIIRARARVLRHQQIIDSIPLKVSTHPVRYGPITLNPGPQSVTLGLRSIVLGRLEFKLLHCLCEHAGQYVPRQTLALWLWQEAQAPHSRKLDNLVLSLRQQLPAELQIKCKYAQGYGAFWA